MSTSEKKRKRVVYAIFVVAVIWGLYNQPWKRPSRMDVVDAASSEGGQEQRVPVDTTTLGNKTMDTPLPEALAWEPNPFRARAILSESTILTPAFNHPGVPVLQGTMDVAGERVCVLNGRVLRVGDQFEKWRILQIGRGTTLLSDPGNKPVTLSTQKPMASTP